MTWLPSPIGSTWANPVPLIVSVRAMLPATALVGVRENDSLGSRMSLLHARTPRRAAHVAVLGRALSAFVGRGSEGMLSPPRELRPTARDRVEKLRGTAHLGLIFRSTAPHEGHRTASRASLAPPRTAT